MADDLDETLEESFPASDAPANTPETGIGVDGSSSGDAASAGKDDEDQAQPAPENTPS
jgi:hypothetical protein